EFVGGPICTVRGDRALRSRTELVSRPAKKRGPALRGPGGPQPGYDEAGSEDLGEEIAESGNAADDRNDIVPGASPRLVGAVPPNDDLVAREETHLVERSTLVERLDECLLAHDLLAAPVDP